MTDRPEAINDSIMLLQNPGSLAFGTDAYLLSAYLRHAPKQTACELGTGSGVISLLAAARGRFSHITAVEIQEPLVSLAVRNVEKNGFSDKIDVICADIRQSAPAFREAFGVVFANPPYLPRGCGKESENAADAASRHEVYGGIMDFAAAAAAYLRYGGLFYTVYRPDRLPELLLACKQHRLTPKRMTLVFPTIGHTPSLVLLEAKKHGAPGLFLTKPLIIYRAGMEQKNENYTDDMKYIYENGAFHEQYQKP